MRRASERANEPHYWSESDTGAVGAAGLHALSLSLAVQPSTVRIAVCGRRCRRRHHQNTVCTSNEEIEIASGRSKIVGKLQALVLMQLNDRECTFLCLCGFFCTIWNTVYMVCGNVG
jgi:hypothetical protein